MPPRATKPGSRSACTIGTFPSFPPSARSLPSLSPSASEVAVNCAGDRRVFRARALQARCRNSCWWRLPRRGLPPASPARHRATARCFGQDGQRQQRYRPAAWNAPIAVFAPTPVNASPAASICVSAGRRITRFHPRFSTGCVRTVHCVESAKFSSQARRGEKRVFRGCRHAPSPDLRPRSGGH